MPQLLHCLWAIAYVSGNVVVLGYALLEEILKKTSCAICSHRKMRLLKIANRNVNLRVFLLGGH